MVDKGSLCLEVAGLALLALALFALRDVAQLSVIENELHLDLAATGAEKLLRDDPDPRVLADDFCHDLFPPFTDVELSLCYVPDRGKRENLPKLRKFINYRRKVKYARAVARTLLPSSHFFRMMNYRMKRYKGFLFDADNTLFDYDRAEVEALTETLGDAFPGIPLEKTLAAYREINAGFWRRFEQGAIRLEDLKAGRFQALLDSLGRNGDAQAISSRYLEGLSRRAYFLPHAREVIEELSRAFALAIVTNGIGMVQRGRIARSGIGHRFQALIISEELGIAKPDPRFFQAAVEAVGLQPDELLCVGDNPASDIEGARAAGIDSCWYSPQGRPWPGPWQPPTLVISDLREILDLAS
jgi:2-haloacid dehalogenase